MNDNEFAAAVPILQKTDANTIRLETACVFNATMVFVNHLGTVTRMGFTLPPGLFPNPKYIPKLIKEGQREALKALKLETKDLSWRLPTPTEFVRITTSNPSLLAYREWAEPYTVELLDEEEPGDNDHNSN